MTTNGVGQELAGCLIDSQYPVTLILSILTKQALTLCTHMLLRLYHTNLR